MAERLVFIDGLRGLAATIVVLHHLVGRTTADWLMHWGYLGVAVFFVLSGFVIAMSIGARNVSLGFLKRFALKREIRLAPPYWISIATAITLSMMASYVGISRPLPSLGNILAHLIYFQDLLKLEPISTIYWTLAFEIQFYLFLILLLWTGKRWFLPLLIATFTISLLENSGLIDIAPNGLFIGYWYSFSLGAMTYYVTSGRMPKWALEASMIAALVFTPFRHADWLFTAILTSGVIFLAHQRGALASWLSDHVSQFFGRISYSLYLFHPLIGWTAQSLALKFVHPLLALAVGIAASIVSAWLAYVLIEKRSVRWSKLVPMDASRPLPVSQQPAGL